MMQADRAGGTINPGGTSEPQSVSLLEARYGVPAAAPAQWSDVLSVMLSHRSVRRYTDEQVTDETLSTIIAAAQSASTSSSLQSWSVVVVRDQGRKERLSALSDNQACIRTAPVFLVWLADMARIQVIAAQQDKTLEGVQFLEAMLIGAIDAALSAQNALTAAEALGLGGVFVGSIRDNPEDVADELGLPPYILPVFGMCLGRADPAHATAVKPRLPQSVVVHAEQYSADLPASVTQQYDEVMNSFFEQQGVKSVEWSKKVVQRMLTPKSLYGRERLREALHNRGFQLR